MAENRLVSRAVSVEVESYDKETNLRILPIILIFLFHWFLLYELISSHGYFPNYCLGMKVCAAQQSLQWLRRSEREVSETRESQ